LDRIFEDTNALEDFNDVSIDVRNIRKSDLELATQRAKSIEAASVDSVALTNSQLEIERLKHLLEDEMNRQAEKYSKLEKEFLELKHMKKLATAASIKSPPASRRRNSVRSPYINTAGDKYLPVGGRYLIGLTGGLASGKSTVGEMLAELGATVIDADQLAAELQQKGQDTYHAIVSAFGAEILNPETQEICREKLSEVVFSNPSKLKMLEKLMHKAIGDESLKRMQMAKSQVVVYQAAQLLEAGTFLCNSIWVVSSDRETQIKRLLERGNYTEEEAEYRVDSQNSMVSKATVVLDNGGSNLSQLKAQIFRAWSVIPQKSAVRTKVLAKMFSVDASNVTLELFEGADVVFGRSEDCNIQLNDVTVSHKQCRVFYANDAFWLDDLSTHGTYVNQKKVGHGMRVKLRTGDSVWLSKLSLKSKSLNNTFVFQLYDELESRTVEFPSQYKVLGSHTDKFLERKSRHNDITYAVNVRTGDSVVVQPKK
jgi:dephospho-CoA kinase